MEPVPHSLLPQYDPRSQLKNFRYGEDFKYTFETLRKVKVLYEEPLTDLEVDKEWKRPKEICSKPYFIKNKPSRFDALQGGKGNCYLVAAMIAVTLHDGLIQHVVPHDQNFDQDYIGAFHFRIWRLGIWYDVVIDDRIPVFKSNQKPCFTHSASGDVFWACLLEKAYAKFCGLLDQFYWDPANYENLNSGYTMTSLLTLSGCIVEKVEGDAREHMLVPAYFNEALICCMIPGDSGSAGKTKLRKQHAYTITRVQKWADDDPDYEGLCLVRLMNPWGHYEWEGEWSDHDWGYWKQIPKDVREKLELVVKDDGEFWMEDYRLLSFFKKIIICHIGPGQFLKSRGITAAGPWRSIFMWGEWVKNVSAGGSDRSTRHMNPQHRLELKRANPNKDCSHQSPVIIDITLWSRRGRLYRSSVGFYIYAIDLHTKLPLDKDYIKSHKALNEDQMDFPMSDFRAYVYSLNLGCPGEFVLIPCTWESRAEYQYMVRVFVEHDVEIWENEVPNPKVEFNVSKASPYEENVVDKVEEGIKKVFDSVAYGKGEVDWIGLRELLESLMNHRNDCFHSIYNLLTCIQDFFRGFVSSDDSERGTIVFSKEECRTMIAMLDHDHNGKLSYWEFMSLWDKIRFWTEVYEHHKEEKGSCMSISHLRDALSSLGYDINTRSVHSLTYIYADESDMISLTDFILCGVCLETITSHHQRKCKEVGKRFKFSLEDWIKSTLIL